MITPSVVARIPVLAGATAADAVRLGGLTNLNYLVSVGGAQFVVRIPGDGTGEYIDRSNEAVAARVASEAGVNADLVFFDEIDGLMATRFVEGAVTMSGPAFAADLGAVARAASAFARLHRCGRRFANDFVLFPMIDEYKALLASRGAALPDGYDDVQASVLPARRALEAHPAERVACHCDPLCENFLDTGTRMYLIDYEYAGNNDPMWDLGDLSIEGGFSPAQDAVLLDAYFDGSVPAAAEARMVVYKAMADLLWTLWGVIQHVNGNPADDFWAYAVGRFERCRALIGSPAWPHLVAAI